MAQTYLFRKQVWQNLQQKISNSNKIFLFLDYDGTIVSIKKHPSLAVLPLITRTLIAQLARHSNISVCIVTGRSLNDIRNLLGIKNILYAANHGFQIHHKKRTWIHPDVKRVLPLIKKVEGALVKGLKPIKGFLIENKGFTLSVHYRNVKPEDVQQLKIILKIIVSLFYEALKLTAGKKVIEVRPQIQWDKGKAILKILKMYRVTDKSTVIFIGDDKTDEDAFRLLPSHAITIRVAKNKSTYAKYYLRNSSEVRQLLENIISLKHNQRGLV
ncbi:MAG: trehalose-phosphatase [Bacteroidota bacterium]|nr:trehalose-phosphatase [Bacteroidota bacterium]